MSVTSIVNPTFFSPAESYQQEDSPAILTDVEAPEVEEAVPYRPGYGRRVIVILMAMLLGAAIFAILGLTLVQGSWWYSYGTDLPLDNESRLRVEAILDFVLASLVLVSTLVILAPRRDTNGTKLRAKMRSSSRSHCPPGPSAFSSSRTRIIAFRRSPSRIAFATES